MSEMSFRGGRAWIDEIPDGFRYEALQVVSLTLTDAPGLNTPTRALCFEVNLRRERNDYGVLGFNYKPDESGRLLIEVHVADEPGQQKRAWDALGLSNEYGSCVLNHAKVLLLESNVFGSGHLVFKYAREHPVDSHPHTFRLLIQILFTLITRNLTSLTEEEKHNLVSDEERKLFHRYEQAKQTPPQTSA